VATPGRFFIASRLTNNLTPDYSSRTVTFIVTVRFDSLNNHLVQAYLNTLFLCLSLFDGGVKRGAYARRFQVSGLSTLNISPPNVLTELSVVSKFHLETIMHNQELIPVFTGTIAGTPAQLVDARTLHAFLEVGKDFSNWIKNRIKQYDFQENKDYTLAKTGELDNQGFQGRIEYHLTLDMAKELSMVKRNAKGKEARRHFIECEKPLLGQIPDHIAKAYDELVANKIPEYLKIITTPLTLVEFKERYHFHENALENLKDAQVAMPARNYLTLKHNLNQAQANSVVR
jgi:phage anti-repressor protein